MYHNRLILTGIVLTVIGIIFYLTFQVVKPFFGVIATALIFTIFLNPLYLKLLRVTDHKVASAILTVVTLFLFMIIPLGLLTSNLLSEVLELSRSLQGNTEWIDSTQSTIEHQLAAFKIPLKMSDFNLNEQIYQSLTFITRNLGSLAVRSGGVLLDLFFVIITVYFLLTKQGTIAQYLNHQKLFPKHYLKVITTRSSEIVNGTVRGYLLVVVLQLVVGLVGFLIVQIPGALLLGSLYGFSSLLPLIGGFLVWIPIVVWQLFVGNVTTAIFLTVWFLVLSFAVENIIAPKIIGNNTKLHQLFIMFSIFGGIQYFGLIGLVLGPVVIALAFVAISMLNEITSEKELKPILK